ncbi:MAG: LLM class flavin-dependent oxidoreductase [Streptosporangiales bacterium]|nr:LLM class flavin-dependent oxidoreductase [Streptosporangiales bacterium]
MSGSERNADARVTFGLLLPHFGSDVDVGGVLELARSAERYGFSCVWVRDRLTAAAPHGLLLEAGGTCFLDPLLTLASVASVTSTVGLGTAVLTPTRHPVKLLQDLGTLDRLAAGRLRLGVGLGVSEADMASVGVPGADRKELFTEYMDVLGRGLRGGPVTYDGTYFQADAVTIEPAPPADLPIYYGGTSRAAVRRAFTYGEGWIAGRLPLDMFAERMRLVRKLAGEHGRDIDVVTMPITVVHEDSVTARHTVRDAVTRLAESAEGSTSWLRPPSGRFETIEDLSGLLIAGNPQECAAEVRKLAEVGVRHIVFDLRVDFPHAHESVALLGEQVLPEF